MNTSYAKQTISIWSLVWTLSFLASQCILIYSHGSRWSEWTPSNIDFILLLCDSKVVTCFSANTLPSWGACIDHGRWSLVKAFLWEYLNSRAATLVRKGWQTCRLSLGSYKSTHVLRSDWDAWLHTTIMLKDIVSVWYRPIFLLFSFRWLINYSNGSSRLRQVRRTRWHAKRGLLQAKIYISCQVTIRRHQKENWVRIDYPWSYALCYMQVTFSNILKQ